MKIKNYKKHLMRYKVIKDYFIFYCDLHKKKNMDFDAFHDVIIKQNISGLSNNQMQYFIALKGTKKSKKFIIAAIDFFKPTKGNLMQVIWNKDNARNIDSSLPITSKNYSNRNYVMSYRKEDGSSCFGTEINLVNRFISQVQAIR